MPITVVLMLVLPMMIGTMLLTIIILLAAVAGTISHRAVDGIAPLSRSSARRGAQ